MALVVAPDEEECYLLAILDGADGLDLAEFAWADPESDDDCYRAWDFQWKWYTCEDMYQVDQGGRATGKTVSITMRAFALPFTNPGQKMLLTAPELNHLRPLTDAIEQRLLTTRLSREMLPPTKGNGMTKTPHWSCRFKNGTQIVSRLPNKDGKGVKGCVAGSYSLPFGMRGTTGHMSVTGALVLTKRGNIPIEDVVEGDEVLTHLNRWRKVLGTFHYKDTPVYEVAGGGHRGLLMSETHDMYARRNKNPQRKVSLEPATWITPATEHAEEIDKRWYFGSPTSVPAMDLPWMPHDDQVAVMALAGAYVADGTVQFSVNTGRPLKVSLTDDGSEVPRLQKMIAAVGLHAATPTAKPSQAVRLDVCNEGFSTFVFEHFGRLSHAKKIPVWLFGAPENLRRAFLDAYLAGDGWWDEKKGRWQASTASKELAVGLRLLGQSLGYTCGFSWVDPKQTEIMGATLKNPARRSYRVTFTVSGRNAVVEDNISWQKIRSVEKYGQDIDVYDLFVEEDHSYLVDGVISHNQHVLLIELDEAQDYPLAGWIEIVETLNRFMPGAMWRCHGVPKGVRDKFFEMTEGATEEAKKWTVHRPMAMNRPTWADEERQEKIKEYGGSRQNIDFKRNIYGEHGDASNSVFVLSRLMACVDVDLGSEYNSEVYTHVQLEFERLPSGPSITNEMREASLLSMINLPGSHIAGYSQIVDRKEVGAPKGYSSYWGGADIGVTNHPSEFLIFGQRLGTDVLELLTRINLQRINTDDQKAVIQYLFDFYGTKLRAFALDKTGVGFPIWDQLSRYPGIGPRIYGYNFSEKIPVAFEDRPLEGKETKADLAIMRNVVEATTDILRNDFVDAKKLRLPYDREILLEFQGQTYTVIKDTGSPYGQKRLFGGGSFHTLDAAKMVMAGKVLPSIMEMLNEMPARPPVMDIFVGAI